MKINSKTLLHSKVKMIIKIAGIWTAIFSPVVIVILTWVIPFGNALTRTIILKQSATMFGKFLLLLMISLPILYGLNKILSLLHTMNIYPKRGELLITALALAWIAHTIYILFIR